MDSLEEAIEEISRAIGEAAGDISSGHARWEIYRRAIDTPQSWGTLIEAIGLEVDPAIATSVAVGLLERVPSGMQESIIAAVRPAKNREFVALRARETNILESLSTGRFDVAELGDDLDSWSNWLQLHAAEDIADSGVLDMLAQRGRTKRIRNVASQRMRTMT